MLKTGFIGAGTTGTALAVSLSRKRWPVAGVCSRTLSSAQRLAKLVPDCQVYRTAQELADAIDLVFITTPDDAIATVCNQVQWREGQSVVHCSGVHSVDILESARKAGAAVGSLHPLQTFANADLAMENLPGSTFALEAEGALLSTLKQLAVLLRGSWVELKPGDKVLYHAAAVFACNYMVTLVKLALDLWHDFGVPPREATRALLPLLAGTVGNIASIGLPGCLTGPVARGDIDTISRHLSALRARDPSLHTIYRELGLQTIPVALAKGKVDEQRAREMRALLDHAETPGHCHSQRPQPSRHPEGVPTKSGRPKNTARARPKQASERSGDYSPG